MVILQPMKIDETPDGPPLIAIDPLGSRRGDRVMISSDGSYAREVTNHDKTPARWTVVGLID